MPICGFVLSGPICAFVFALYPGVPSRHLGGVGGAQGAPARCVHGAAPARRHQRGEVGCSWLWPPAAGPRWDLT